MLREQLVPLGGDPGYGLGDSSLRLRRRYWDQYLVQLPSARDTNQTGCGTARRATAPQSLAPPKGDA